MFAIVVDDPGADSRLRYTRVPDPVARPHDVVVKVYAAGVNRADLSFRRGAYGNADWGDSALIGLEIAGEIVELGPEAAPWKVGDRVMAIVGGGGYAEFARVDSRMLMAIPPRLGFIEAAAIPEAFVTAHESLCHLAGVAARESVLIHAAASGVGTAAVQLATSIGARVLTTSSASKIGRLRELGAHHCIDRIHEDFAAQVRAWSQGRGVDVVLDFIGGAYLQRNVASLADGGRLVLAGLMGGAEAAPLPVDRVVLGHTKVFGTVMKSRSPAEKCSMVSRFTQRWLGAVWRGELAPVIDRIFFLADAESAHRRVASNEGFGKVVLQVVA